MNRRPILCRILTVSLFLVPASIHAQAGSTTGDDASFEKFKQEVRESGKDNPDETKTLLEHFDADRQRLKKYRAHPEEIEKDLAPLIERLRVKNSSTTIMEFAHAQSALKKQITWLFQNGVMPPTDVGNRMSEEIMDIYAEHKKFWNIPTYFPMEFVARYGNSRKVKNYVFGILNGPSKEERDEMLSDLAWSGSFVDDQELYDVLMGIYKKEGESTALPLAVMSRLNRKKALPIVLHEIDTTTKIKTFTQDEDILSEYHDPNLLDHPLRRIKDFPRTSWTDIKNPTLGIYSDLLLKYIQNADGERLELGLAALEQSVDTLMKSYPVIREKLKSANPASRRAAAKFLLRSTDVSIFNRPEITDELEAISSSETDSETQQATRVAVQKLRATYKRHHP